MLCAVAAEVARALVPGEGGLVLPADVKAQAHAAILALPVDARAEVVEHLVMVAARVVALTGGRDDTPAFDDVVELAAIAAWDGARGADAVASALQEKLARRLVASEDATHRAPRDDEPRATVHRIPIRG